MNKKEEITFIKQELYKAITYFIKRQQLVAQLMIDLGLDLEEVGKWGALTWASGSGIAKESRLNSDKDVLNKDQEVFDVIKRASERKLSQSGIWSNKNEWEYFLHGRGCRLRNVNTEETITWNCPSVLVFDPYFFLDHLKWRIDTHYREDELYHIRKWLQQQSNDLQSILTFIEEMVDNGLINPDFTLPNMV